MNTATWPRPRAPATPSMTGRRNRPKLSVAITPTVHERPAGGAAASGVGADPTAAASGTHQPVTRARLDAGLLRQWQERNLTASLPLAVRQLEDAGNLDNVRLAIRAARAAGSADAEGEAASAADGYGAAGGHRP